MNNHNITVPKQFEKLSSNIIDNIIELNKTIKVKVSAKDLLTEGRITMRPFSTGNRKAVLKYNNNIYYTNGIFIIKKGYFRDLDEIFESYESIEDASDEINLADFFSNYNYAKLEPKLKFTKVYSAENNFNTIFINSHFYRYFKLKGITNFAESCGCLLLLSDTGETIGFIQKLLLDSEVFENDLSVEKYSEMRTLVESYFDFYKNAFFEHIINTCKYDVFKNIYTTYLRYKDNLDDTLKIIKDIDGYYGVGFYFKKSPYSFTDTTFVFSATSNSHGYSTFTDNDFYLGGPQQRITKPMSKKLATLMLNEINNEGVAKIIDKFNNLSQKESEAFDNENLILNGIKDSLSSYFIKTLTDDSKIEYNFKFREAKPFAKAAMDFKTSLNTHFLISMEDGLIKVQDLNFSNSYSTNDLDPLQEADRYAHKEVVKFETQNQASLYLFNIIKHRLLQHKTIDISIRAIKEFLTNNQSLIITTTNNEVLYSTPYGYQQIRRGSLKDYKIYRKYQLKNSLTLKDDQASFLYYKYISKSLESISIYTGEKFDKKSLNVLEKISFDDIISNYKHKHNFLKTVEGLLPETFDSPSSTHYIDESNSNNYTNQDNIKLAQHKLSEDIDELTKTIIYNFNKLNWSIQSIYNSNCIVIAEVKNRFNIIKHIPIYNGSVEKSKLLTNKLKNSI